MKNQRIFPGIILIGVGAYFFLQQTSITMMPQLFTWPTLMLIIGIAFLGQGYIGKDYEAILPGVILVGFGLYFHVLNQYAFWSNQVGSFVLIVALGCLLRYQKTHSGLFQAVLFLILSIILLFYDKISTYFGLLQNGVSMVWKFWPLVLIGIGFFLLYKRKK
ncbi:LiaI-LiaF-like domain-containing protein [Bacillus sp. EB600]|uniref:LiaI-LiaF-like domain-containing protein n=1 Tax=Bacillus sp. EB600 TaxID=2806345 RepID=UPI00210C8680|nr:DUF5668 domain-containing protein [Bacillus sp. EB600]MCQ6278287.1 hypothetical protein [Bacillus sp. EB600]